MSRRCARPGCAERAAATFGYDYSLSTVWLVDLADEAHPHSYDLCRQHADGLDVPRGWELRDRRNLVPSIVREAS